MKIRSEDFINADDEQKEKLIDMIVEFETHNSISKDCLVAVVKHQKEKIETLEKPYRQRTSILDMLRELQLKEGKIDASIIKASKIGWETGKEKNDD